MFRKQMSWALSHPRFLLLLIASAIVVAFFAWRLLPRDTSSAVTVNGALTRFRELAEQEPDSTQAANGTPVPGVYRYSVRGGESLDSLLDADHPYDGTATITITGVPCGFEEHWRVLRERWSTVSLCKVGDRLRIERLVDFHEFFGEDRETEYACRRSTTAGVTECIAEHSAVSYAIESLGDETVRIGGRTFAAEHIRSRITLSGETTGSGRNDEWRRRSDGLLLKKRLEIVASVNAPGGGEYREDYRLALRSPRPRR